MLETRQLQLLQVISASGSYSAAARELGYTQPAITYQMRVLEREVGTALAVRRGRQMRLTPAGEALLGHADRVLASLRAAEEEMGHYAGHDAGTVRIASFPSASATIVADTMSTVGALLPGVELSFVQAEPEGARSQARRGDVDIAVTYRYENDRVEPSAPIDPPPAPATRRRAAPTSTGGLHSVPLLRDDMFVVLPEGHPLSREHELHVDQLVDETWFLASERFQRLVGDAVREAGGEARITVVADDYVSMQALVERRLGIALVPGLALAAHRARSATAIRIAGWPARIVEAEAWPDVLRVPSIASTLAVLEDAALRVQARISAD